MNSEPRDARRRPGRLLDLTLWAQATYFVVSGIWPLISIRTFEAITGPKADRWLVKTVGVLVAVVGGVLMLARHNNAVRTDTVVLATGTAAGLAAVEAVYVVKRRIRPVYMLDALLEAVFIAGWLLGLRARREA